VLVETVARHKVAQYIDELHGSVLVEDDPHQAADLSGDGRPRPPRP
jgi:hypothetical protein